MSYPFEPETVKDIIKSMEGKELTSGEPLDLIWRLANAYERELDALYEEIEELERRLGL